MRGRDLVVAGVVGAILGLVAVVAVALMLRYGVVQSGPSGSGVGEPGTLVALVLPAEDGVQIPRVLIYYPSGNGRGVVVDPRTRVAVPGTSGDRIADAYSFGGGAGLARAYSAATSVAVPHWVVVDQSTWPRLANGSEITFRLSEPVDVFNGTDLISFPSGAVGVDATETTSLMQGADHLNAASRSVILASLAGGLQAMLVERAGIVELATDASPEALEGWQQSLKSRGELASP